MGSKKRFAKELLPIILKDRKNGQYYVEPFVGGFNMIDKVDGPRIANDSNYYLIELFKKLQQGYEPPSIITEEQYKEIKNNKDKYPPELVAFVGFCCSFASRFFEGYARNHQVKNYSYAEVSKRALEKQRDNIIGIELFNVDYKKLFIPSGSIVYCDPPYANTKKYQNKFNHDEFWNWVRLISKDNFVFVSEYVAPEDFECIWSKEIKSSLANDRKTRGYINRVEKLFRIKS